VRHWDLDGRLAILLNSPLRSIDDAALNRLNLGIIREETATSAGHRARIEASRETVRSRGDPRSQNTQIPEWGSPEWDRPVEYADSAESIAEDLRVTEQRVSDWHRGERRIAHLRTLPSWQEQRISESPLRGQSEISAARINPPRLRGPPEVPLPRWIGHAQIGPTPSQIRRGPEIQGEADRRSGVRHRFNSPADPWYGNLTRQDRRRVELGLWAPQEHARTVPRRQWTRLWIWFNRWACRIPNRVERPLRHPDPDHPSHIGLDRTHPRLSDSHRGPSVSSATGTPTINSAHRNYRLRNQAISRSYAVLRNSTTEPDSGTSDPTEEAALIAALIASLPGRSRYLTAPSRASSSDQVSHQGTSGSTLPQIPEEDDAKTSEQGDQTSPLLPSRLPRIGFEESLYPRSRRLRGVAPGLEAPTPDQIVPRNRAGLEESPS
jgi:hypothetical protein